jgi:hypothetical protein
LEIDDPETLPCKALLIIATLAGPPGLLPAIAFEISLKNCPIPVFSKKAPNKINKKTNVAQTPKGVPIIPSVL